MECRSRMLKGVRVRKGQAEWVLATVVVDNSVRRCEMMSLFVYLPSFDVDQHDMSLLSVASFLAL